MSRNLRDIKLIFPPLDKGSLPLRYGEKVLFYLPLTHLRAGENICFGKKNILTKIWAKKFGKKNLAKKFLAKKFLAKKFSKKIWQKKNWQKKI